MSHRLTALSRLTPRACLHVKRMHTAGETSAETQTEPQPSERR